MKSEIYTAAHAVDAVVFGIDQDGDRLQLLLVERGIEPFVGQWALPGGFVREGESLEDTLRRELVEETGLAISFIEQLYTYGDVGRDPRGRVISTAYLGLVRPSQVTLAPGTDASNARWFDAGRVPSLAFDHKRVVRCGIERLRSKLPWQPVGIELLPTHFSLTELQRVYEIILGRSIDKRNFRRKLLGMEVLIETEKTRGEGHRPARLYRFDRKRYRELQRGGKDFELA